MRVTAQPKKQKDKDPEDKIIGRVVTRLRIETGATYDDISDWLISKNNYMTPSSVCDLSSGKSTRYPSRIVSIAEYFREVHGLSYVNADYLLTGSDKEQEYVKAEREINRNSRVEEPLPLFDFAEKEAV